MPRKGDLDMFDFWTWLLSELRSTVSGLSQKNISILLVVRGFPGEVVSGRGQVQCTSGEVALSV